jgi:hypothetical protein
VKPTKHDVIEALSKGWTVYEYGTLSLVGDKSEGWCTEWTKFTIDGRDIYAPGFLRRRLDELAYENSSHKDLKSDY